jgi:hypothetical protein
MKKGRLLTATVLVGLIFLSVSIGVFRVNYKASSSTEGSGFLDGVAVITYGLVINVSDYGGSTDYERIQNALNDVPPDGAVVFIPSGVWEACNLSALSRTVVMGGDGTILRRPPNTTSPFLIFENRTGFAVVDLIFDGQNVPDASGLLVSNGTSFQIANDTFRDVDTNAVNIVGRSEDFVVEGNIFVNSNNAPVRVWGTPGGRIVSGFLIVNNTLLDSQTNGKIGVAFADNGTIRDNHIFNCTYGIATRDDCNLLIENNRIENVTSYGIYLGTQIEYPDTYGLSSNIVISSNYIFGSNVGIARYYGCGLIVNVSVSENIITYSNQLDIYADFQASFVNNTVSCRDNVALLTPPAEFVGNVDVNGTPVMPADITGDCRVDMRDLGGVARLYGTVHGSANWNQMADVIQDGVIDMRDLGFVAKCFQLNY